VRYNGKEVFENIRNFAFGNYKLECKTNDIMKRLVLIASVMMLPLMALAQRVVGTTIHNPNAGGLCQVLSQEQIDACTKLILTGELNSEDLRLLRRMAGYKEHNGDKVGHLVYLDLSGVRFKSGKKPYLTVNAEKARLFLYQDVIYTSPEESFSRASASGGMYERGHMATEIPYILGSSWGYRKNFALLNFDDSVEVVSADSYRMTSKKQKGIHFQSLRNIRGHHVKKVNGEWIWSSHIRRGQFCYDMFYGCPNLEVVILPESGKCCDRVFVYKDGIDYYPENKLLLPTIYYPMQ